MITKVQLYDGAVVTPEDPVASTPGQLLFPELCASAEPTLKTTVLEVPRIMVLPSVSFLPPWTSLQVEKVAPVYMWGPEGDMTLAVSSHWL